MPGSTIYDTCPHCGEIRNYHGMKTHIIKAHTKVVA